ncbi:hypothetical protein M8C21_016601 [Ambrosia artemisiifolia]|uniref:Uncharacterized protein n=1 Tax=Ambrosia artemisiifolia TaxID=4212 RepID=A0AAD5CG37_AMBAR|nr:hypothetical protein M8C21_016601 [Ambrosia artemisiifolia]
MQGFCLSLPRILRRTFVACNDVGLSLKTLLPVVAASACAAAIAFRAFRCRIPHALHSDYKEKIMTF